MKLCYAGNSVTRSATGTSPPGGFRGLSWPILQGDYTVQFVGTLTEGFGVWDHHEGYGGYGIGESGGGPAPQISDIIATMATTTPDIVVLEVGANDLVQSWSTPTIRSTMLSRLGTLLDRIHTALPYARVVVCNLWVIDFTYWAATTGTTATNTDRTNYNSGLAGVVSTRSAWAQTIDSSSTLTLSDVSSIDGLHPIYSGHEKLANAITAALAHPTTGALTLKTNTALADGRTLLNSACGEGAVDMRAGGGGQHLWFLQQVAGRINRSVPALTSVDDTVPLTAAVQRGNWVVRCTTCQETSAVWCNRQLMFCANCWNSAVGNVWRTVTLPDAATRGQIEALLAARPVANRWWTTESVSALAAENTLNGW